MTSRHVFLSTRTHGGLLTAARLPALCRSSSYSTLLAVTDRASPNSSLKVSGQHQRFAVESLGWVASALLATAFSASIFTEHGALQCDEEITTQRAKIVVFGDSLTQQGFMVGGWVQRLADRYCRRADVLNRGYSGYNTRWASPVLQKLLADGMGDGAVLWIIWLGANDAAVPDTHRQHVPVEEYEARLAMFAQQVKANSRASLVFVTPLAVDEQKYLAFLRLRNPSLEVPDRLDSGAQKYAEAVRRVATTSGVPVLDVYTAMHEQKLPVGSFLSDGLHLNENGGELVANLVFELIESKFPSLRVTPCRFTGQAHNSGSVSALPPEFPWHDKIKNDPPHHSMFSTL